MCDSVISYIDGSHRFGYGPTPEKAEPVIQICKSNGVYYAVSISKAGVFTEILATYKRYPSAGELVRLWETTQVLF